MITMVDDLDDLDDLMIVMADGSWWLTIWRFDEHRQPWGLMGWWVDGWWVDGWWLMGWWLLVVLVDGYNGWWSVVVRWSRPSRCGWPKLMIRLIKADGVTITHQSASCWWEPLSYDGQQMVDGSHLAYCGQQTLDGLHLVRPPESTSALNDSS
jgi:GAF domain-containing protein